MTKPVLDSMNDTSLCSLDLAIRERMNIANPRGSIVLIQVLRNQLDAK